jgi:hypothetical protein
MYTEYQNPLVCRFHTIHITVTINHGKNKATNSLAVTGLRLAAQHIASAATNGHTLQFIHDILRYVDSIAFFRLVLGFVFFLFFLSLWCDGVLEENRRNDCRFFLFVWHFFYKEIKKNKDRRLFWRDVKFQHSHKCHHPNS